MEYIRLTILCNLLIIPITTLVVLISYILTIREYKKRIKG